MHAQARGEVGLAVAKLHSAGKIGAHDADHVVDVERVRHFFVAHGAPGGEFHFLVLQMEGGVGQFVIVARVIVVQVREYHVADRGGLDAEFRQHVDRAVEKLPLARGRVLLRHAGIDDESLVRRARDPHEIIHRHRHIVRIAAEKMARAHRIARAVAQGKHFILGQAQAGSPRKGRVERTMLASSRRVHYCSRSRDYSITVLACTSIELEIFRPSALAVFMLITISKTVGCSTGRSAGLAPLKILST